MKRQTRPPRTRICAALGCAILALAARANADDDITKALTGGKTSIDARYRLETVDQQNALKNATASTVRLRLGYETGQYAGLSVMAEAEHLTALGGAAYNSTINGKTNYSVVADPEFTEINQAYVAYTSLPGTKLKYGRQRLVLDNHRFIGNVGWRQNEQTFDAFTAVNQWLPDTTVTAGYIYNVNRVFGDRSAVGDLKMKAPLLNVNYKGLGAGEIVGYAYLLDFVDRPADSAQTYGLRFSGSSAIGSAVNALYTAEYASQSDYRDNPASFNLNYYLLEGGATVDSATFKLGYEVLGGNGRRAFQTPLATLHAFNGWTDQFLTTPVNGLKDAYLSAGTVLQGVKLEAIYHDFRADAGSARYGTEWDLVATKAIGKNYLLGVKYGSYRAKDFAVDTDKLWLYAEAKF
ncbi:alginate export family protein [Herbaspirillum sp. ST 5-3]|uniref:alginate export family protein n=1 Tax=Herbaspirillum sp. ST 5-3 TaxID=2567936 RepID=UPI0010A56B8C|nr:alginate export family protein [Herbaspirillum sp. ST 5-3]